MYPSHMFAGNNLTVLRENLRKINVDACTVACSAYQALLSPTKESLGSRLISLVPSCLYGLNLCVYIHVYVCVLCWKLLSNTVLLSTFSSILYDWLVVCIGVLQNRNHLEFVQQ